MSKREHEVYRITEIKDEAKDVKTFRFDKNIIALPGEFVMVWLPDVSENPFSISYYNPLGITVKKVGDENSFTSRLFKLKIGDRLWFRGSYGSQFPTYPVGNSFHYKNIYLMGGGTGAIPLALFSEVRAILGFFPTVFLGAKTKDDIIFEERFRKFSKKLLISTEDGSSGYKGLVTDLFNEVEIDPNPLFYICGPEKMMFTAAEKAMKYTDKENVFLSLERYMKCGRGLCGSCEVNGYRTCVDGPVFTYKQLTEEDFGNYKRTKSGLREKL
jgi:dihydroorotate dehydrogenase electron transfer subunit